VVSLLAKVPKAEREALWKRLRAKTPPRGAAASSASILGKNYLKQVDVVISNWIAGPELLISTKRMDSSFGKNAANRVEESYGDAKNLRLRHPLAALGFAYGLRTTIFDESPDKADWLIDLLQKLGEEEDAYHAVALILMEYDVDPPAGDDANEGEHDDALVGAGLVEASDDVDGDEPVDGDEIDSAIQQLPSVTLDHARVPERLSPAHFLATMTRHAIHATPINLHKPARERLANPR
jgi:hypothetical protein